jgi:hypothetical protein
MATLTDANLFIKTEVEEIKRVTYHFEIRKKKYSLVKVWVDGILESKIALDSEGYNITTPSTVQFLEEIIEESI